jgi:hypothetical protein
MHMVLPSSCSYYSWWFNSPVSLSVLEVCSEAEFSHHRQDEGRCHTLFCWELFNVWLSIAETKPRWSMNDIEHAKILIGVLIEYLIMPIFELQGRSIGTCNLQQHQLAPLISSSLALRDHSDSQSQPDLRPVTLHLQSSKHLNYEVRFFKYMADQTSHAPL